MRRIRDWIAGLMVGREIAEYLDQHRKALRNAQMDAEGAREMLYWADRLVEWYRCGESQMMVEDEPRGINEAYQRTTVARPEDVASDDLSIPQPPKPSIPLKIHGKTPSAKLRD